MIKKQFFPEPTIQNVASNDAFYLRGKALYKDQRVQSISGDSDKNSVTVHVTENGDNKVSWGFFPNGLAKRYHCTCDDFKRFSGGCQHIVASMMALNEIEAADVPTDGGQVQSQVSVESQINLLNDQAIDELFGSEENEADTVRRSLTQLPVEIDFTLLVGKPDFFQPFAITMRVGEEYLYVVQNVREVVRDLLEGKEIVFGKRFTFDRDFYTIKEKDLALLRTLKEIDDVFESVEAVQQFSSPKEFTIPPQFIQRVLKQLEACDHGHVARSYKRSMDQATGKETKPVIHTSPATLPVMIHLENEEENHLKLTTDNQTWQDLLFYHQGNFIEQDGHFYMMSTPSMERLKRLKHAFSLTNDRGIVLAGDQASNFISRFLPQIEKLVEIDISEEVSGSFIRKELKAQLKIDYLKDELVVSPEFHYGDFVVEPLKDKTELEVDTGIFIRDIEREKELLKKLRYSSNAWEDNQEQWFIRGVDAVGDFLYGAMPELMDSFEILMSSTANRLVDEDHSSPTLGIELNEGSNMLSVSFETEDLSDDDLKMLMKKLHSKKKFVKLANGKLVKLDSDNYQNLAQSVDSLDLDWDNIHQEMAVPVFKGISLSENDDIKQGARFKQLVSQLFSPEELEFEMPKQLNATLRPYQETGVKWLKTLDYYGFGGVLADDMGLGKTLQTIGYVTSCLEENKGDRFLIICPSSVLFNWQKEFETFAPSIKTMLIQGSAEEREQIIAQGIEDDIPVWITSYPLIMRDSGFYQNQNFRSIILDEAQYVKNQAAKTTQAVKRIRSRTKIALSGTPIENNLGELFTMFSIVMPGLFTNQSTFKAMDAKEIAQKIRAFILRRLKKDVLEDLPEKVETNEYIHLSNDQKKLYQTQVQMIRTDLETIENKQEFDSNRFRILAGMTRLRQICCDPRLIMPEYTGESSKLERLKEYVADALENGKRLVIFSQFTSMLSLIKEEFDVKGYDYFYLDGSTKSSDRLELTTRYNEGEKDIFLISLKAGGTGLNLTGGDTVVLYDSWWNPAIEEQAADRVHRYGQKKTVQVIRMIAEGTIEERINELQEKKRKLIDTVIETGEQSLTSLSKDEILSLLDS